VPGFPWRKQAMEQLKIMAGTLAFAFVLWLTANFAGLFKPNLSLAGQLFGIVAAVGLAGAAYLSILLLLNVEDVCLIRKKITKR